MKRILLASFLLMFWGGAWADLVATNGPNELRLMHSPCVHAGILGQLKEEFRPQFKKAQAIVGGKLFYACWIDNQEGAYVVFFEDGDMSMYPVTGFKVDPQKRDLP